MCIYVYRMYIFVSCVLNKLAIVSSLWSLKKKKKKKKSLYYLRERQNAFAGTG